MRRYVVIQRLSRKCVQKKNTPGAVPAQCMLHPHTSREGASNDVKVLRTFSYISAVRRSVNANRHSFNPKNCARWSDWPSEAPKSGSKKEDRRWRRKRQNMTGERLRINWGWGTVPNVLLKLLVKDKPTLQRKSMWTKGNETSEERETRLQRVERQTGSWNSEERDWRLQQTRTNQHAKLAVETGRGEITLHQRSTNQREWLAENWD